MIEESLEVGKNKVSAGKRLKTEVSEREVQETVNLHEESVEVERTRADRTLKPGEANKAFKETTVEVTAYTEKPVVSKEAHVVEEVSLSKNSGERDVTVSGTVRRQDVTVEEIDQKVENLEQVLTTEVLRSGRDPLWGFFHHRRYSEQREFQNSQPFTCRMTTTAASARMSDDILDADDIADYSHASIA